VSAERACEHCGAPLDGRRPEARYFSAACRRSAAREREALKAPSAVAPTQTPWEDAARRAHACENRLWHLERRLDELARGVHSADGRLMAPAMRDALRENGENG
jgi:hypothetical protein